MPRYHVSGEVTVSCTTVVVADSPKKAMAIARDRDQVGLCSTGDPGREGIDPEESWYVGEVDGTPRPLRVEEIVDE